jgi:hypothetical protein
MHRTEENQIHHGHEKEVGAKLYTEDFLDGDVMVVDKLDQLKAVFEQMERALEYIGPDELLEITPESIRLRKLVKKLAKR